MTALDSVPAGENGAAEKSAVGASAPAPRPQRFGLAWQIALWTALITALAVAATAAYLYQGTVGISIDRQKQQLAASVDVAVARAEARFDSARRDAVFVARTPAVAAFVPQAGMPGTGSPAVVDNVAALFAAMLLARQNYFAAAYLDAQGNELIRVDDTAGRITRTLATGMQDRGTSSYFREAATLPAGEVAVSDIRLNQEHGAVQVPFRPVAHVATPVYDARGQLAGVIIISIEMQPLFDLVDRSLGSDSRHYIVNSSGDYLSNPDHAREFGFDRGGVDRLQTDYPGLAPLLLPGTDSALTFDVRHADVPYLAAGGRVAFDPRTPARFLAIASVMPNDALLARMRDLRNRTYIFAAVMILIAAVCAALLARLIVRPLYALTLAAMSIGAGNRKVDLAGAARRRDEAGQLARTLAMTLREISEREDRLTAQAAELTRSNHDLAQFAYVASHDLQEPLRMVSSYLELLVRRYEGQLDSEAHEFIGFAVDGAARMKRLINDLLGYSRIGHSPLRLSVVQAGDIVSTVLSQLGPTILDTGARVDVGPLPKVRVDAVQMARVFQNLIENAIKYRRPGVRPAVKVAAALDSPGHWRFSVTDNGIGIDPAFREKIFEIFKRLHGRDRYAGTGIGLSIAKLVVERHGGRIWFEPAPGGGSVFSFTLPESLENAQDAAAD